MNYELAVPKPLQMNNSFASMWPGSPQLKDLDDARAKICNVSTAMEYVTRLLPLFRFLIDNPNTKSVTHATFRWQYGKTHQDITTNSYHFEMGMALFCMATHAFNKVVPALSEKQDQASLRECLKELRCAQSALDEMQKLGICSTCIKQGINMGMFTAHANYKNLLDMMAHVVAIYILRMDNKQPQEHYETAEYATFVIQAAKEASKAQFSTEIVQLAQHYMETEKVSRTLDILQAFGSAVGIVMKGTSVEIDLSDAFIQLENPTTIEFWKNAVGSCKELQQRVDRTEELHGDLEKYMEKLSEKSKLYLDPKNVSEVSNSPAKEYAVQPKSLFIQPLQEGPPIAELKSI